jgi:hypothetical protein
MNTLKFPYMQMPSYRFTDSLVFGQKIPYKFYDIETSNPINGRELDWMGHYQFLKKHSAQHPKKANYTD